MKTKKEQKSVTPKYIQIKDLPEDFKFKMLDGGRKKFIDIIKMICYRSEIAMTNIILPELTLYDRDTGRDIIKNIFQAAADIYPDGENKTLRVCLHHTNNAKTDKIVSVLMNHMNLSEMTFPGSGLTLFYEFVSS